MDISERVREDGHSGLDGVRIGRACCRELLDPGVEFAWIVGTRVLAGLGFENELAIVDDVEAERPRSVRLMKGVIHAVDEHGHLEVELFLELTRVLQALREGSGLIEAGNDLAGRPLITCVRFGDVDSHQTHARGRLRAK